MRRNLLTGSSVRARNRAGGRPRGVGARRLVPAAFVGAVAALALGAWVGGFDVAVDGRRSVPALGWLFGPRVVVDGVRINPAASIKPNRTYSLTVWDRPVPLPPDVGSYDEALRDAIASFQVEYPNVEVKVQLSPRAPWEERAGGDSSTGANAGVGEGTGPGPGEGDRLDGGTATGDGDESGENASAAPLPDIVGGPVHATFYPERQVPVQSYVDETTAAAFRSGALESVSGDGHTWAWPAWFDWTAGAVKPRAAAASLGSGTGRSGTYVDFVGDTFWRGVAQWAAEQASAAASAGNPGEHVDRLVQSWRERSLVPNERRADAMDRAVERTARTRLTRFTRAEQALTAPVTPLVARMWVGADVALVPFPSLAPGEAVVPMQPAGYAVLLEKPFEGSDHIRVAMALANHLSAEMGAWLAARAPFLTARPAEGGGLPDDWERLLTQALETRTLLPASRERFGALEDATRALQGDAGALLSGERSAVELIRPVEPPIRYNGKE